MWPCARCGEDKPDTDFHWTTTRRMSYCKPCRSELDRSHKLVREYNITLEQYEQLLAAQGGVCSICQRPPVEGGHRLVVDHDHSCCSGPKSCGRCIRGLLCHSCNIALGKLRDSQPALTKAIDYLENGCAAVRLVLDPEELNHAGNQRDRNLEELQ